MTAHHPHPAGFIPASLAGEQASLFALARHTAHRTDFESAARLLADLRSQSPAPGLGIAYEAVVANLLGHDPGPFADEARAAVAASPLEDRTISEAIALFSLGSWADAVACFERFLALHPYDPYARHALGFTQLDLGRDSEGVATLESLLEDEPGFTPALNHLGFGYLKIGDPDRAIATLRTFVERDATNPSARDSLADIFTATGDRASAISELEAAVALAPTFAYGWHHLGSLLLHEGPPGDAAAAFGRARDAMGAYGPRFHALVDEGIARSAAR